MKSSKKNTRSSRYAIGMAIGIPLGMPVGLVLGNLALGPALGVVIGIILGFTFNAMEKNKEESEPSGRNIRNSIWTYVFIFGMILLIETIKMVGYLKP